MAFSGPAFSEFTTTNVTTSTTGNATLTVANQVGLVMIWTKGNSSASTPTGITDTQGNTWIHVGSAEVLNSRAVDIWYTNSTAAGSVTATLTNSAAHTWQMHFFELTKYIALDQNSTFSNNSSTNTFHCAATTALDTTANAIVFATIAMNGSVTSFIPDLTFTIRASDPTTLLYAVQTAEFEAAQTDQRGTFTTFGTARQGPGKSASFIEATPPVIVVLPPTLLLLGVG